jgi:3-oxoacyl-[acyl-carrier protein] reductase
MPTGGQSQRPVAIVTGGSRGIGRAIVERLARDGFDVVATYRRDAAAAADVVSAVERLGGRMLARKVSADSEEETTGLVSEVQSSFGRADAIVHNAGLSSRGHTVADTRTDDFERVMGAHAAGAFYLCRAFVPLLRDQATSSIVLISSQATVNMDPNGAPYNMAKAALEALARTIAQEEASNGIRANVVAPGLVDTEMGRRLVRAAMGVENIRDLDPAFALGSVPTPDDVAAAVSFLVSPDSRLVTGQRLGVDAGGFAFVRSGDR